MAPHRRNRQARQARHGLGTGESLAPGAPEASRPAAGSCGPADGLPATARPSPRHPNPCRPKPPFSASEIRCLHDHEGFRVTYRRESFVIMESRTSSGFADGADRATRAVEADVAAWA